MPLPEGDGVEEYGSDLQPSLFPEQSDEEQGAEEQSPEAPQNPYQPYDLAQARPSIFDPVPEAEQGLKDEEGNPLPAFDDRYKDDFDGLAFIGSLSKQVEWLGHKFVIRTLTVDELLAVAVVTKEYGTTIGNGLAYRTAMVAMGTVSVDGQDLPIPVQTDPSNFAWAFQRFNYVKARWFQFTIDAIYNEYLELEEKTHKVVAAMGKASGLTASTSGLSSNSG